MAPFGKSQDTEFQKSVKLINGYLKKLDSNIPPLSEREMGDFPLANTALSYANIRSEVAVIKPQGQINSDLIFSTAVVPLPKNNLLPLFRQLLVWNNLQTDIAHLAINDQQGVIYMVMRRPVIGLDYSEFRHIVDKISAITMNVLFMLKQQFGI